MIARAAAVLAGIVVLGGVAAGLLGFLTAYAAVVGGLVLLIAAFGLWYRSGWFFERTRRKKLAAFPFAHNQGKVLMIGSSSFQFWATAEQDLAPVEVVNLGIGGTVIADWTAYLDNTVVPYGPRGVMIYAGLNDFNTHANPQTVFERMQLLLDAIEGKLPGIKVLCLGLCPTIARASNWSDIQQFNTLLDEAAQAKGFAYLDSTEVILDATGQLQKAIYRFDGMHFNEQGYACWVKAVKPAVDSLFG